MELRFESAKRFLGENKYYVLFWLLMFIIGFALAIYFFQPKIIIVPAQ